MAVTGIVGKKIGMTQVFDEKGDVHPITVLQAGPCVITQLKTLARDGYEAAQIGLVEFVKNKNVTKPQAGHFAKTEAPPVKVIKEVASGSGRRGRGAYQGRRSRSGRHLLRSQVCGCDWHLQGPRVCRRCAPSRFRGGPKSHGHMFQVQGSIGASSFPSRVFPGQRMPGHMGDKQITVRNLRIRGIDLEENLLMVEGAVPGAREGYVLISKAKAPPRERRGFAGSGTVDPLKASKKAGGKRK
jgi:large subunit ribosomal protein L3